MSRYYIMLFKGVRVFNSKPRNFYRFGGHVKKDPQMTRRQLQNDSVKAILQPGEIVIPVKHADKVAKFLKEQRIKLPNL